jgi:hypothetical protein
MLFFSLSIEFFGDGGTAATYAIDLSFGFSKLPT